MAVKKKTGGRVKGTKNKKTQALEAIREKGLLEGVTPLEVMLKAMRMAWEAQDIELAASHAKEAAPYCHPKLAAVKHEGDEDAPLRTVTTIELVASARHVYGPD